MVERALAADGTSAALGCSDPAPDPGLSASLAGDHRGPVVTTDLFYDPDTARQAAWRARGALAVEMECAAIFAVAAERGIHAAALLLVSDLVLPARARIGVDELRRGEERLGHAAVSYTHLTLPTTPYV